MSLDLNKLEKVVELAGGMMKARCPACAEGGNDRKGEHLRIYPDGRFGCCIHPKDKEHRKRIFALAGERSKPGGFTVRMADVGAVKVESRSVRDSLLLSAGTLGTPFSDSVLAVPSVPTCIELDFGTLGTGNSNLCAYAREEIPKALDVDVIIDKDIETGVPSVPRFPSILSDGTLMIPFDSPERYHWWRGGQSVASTRREILERNQNYASPF